MKFLWKLEEFLISDEIMTIIQLSFKSIGSTIRSDLIRRIVRIKLT